MMAGVKMCIAGVGEFKLEGLGFGICIAGVGKFKVQGSGV
jgi:hypothetical protein